MKAVVRRIGHGFALAGKADSNHWVPMDIGEDSGGTDAAVRPLELLLIGLGGCTGVDVLSILKKKRVRLDDFEMELEADRVEPHPRIFSEIRIVYHFYGEDLKLSDLETAVELSQSKYCSASAILRASAPIASRIEIHPPRPAR